LSTEGMAIVIPLFFEVYGVFLSMHYKNPNKRFPQINSLRESFIGCVILNRNAIRYYEWEIYMKDSRIWKTISNKN
jgi:hypothetical protein